MNYYKVNLIIEDLIYNCNFRDTSKSTYTISTSDDIVNLKCDYILNIIRIESNYFTIILQNGINTIIRNIYTSYPTKICLPCKCATHIITISGTIEENS